MTKLEAKNYALGMKEANTQEHFDMFIDIAIECIEKQIPMKPFLENAKGIYGVDMWHCPVCKDEIISDWNRDIASPYCHHCGQAILWESDNE